MPRPPKPTALKVVEGNRGKRKLPANEPKPRPITPAKPPYLGRIAAIRWDELLRGSREKITNYPVLGLVAAR